MAGSSNRSSVLSAKRARKLCSCCTLIPNFIATTGSGRLAPCAPRQKAAKKPASDKKSPTRKATRLVIALRVSEKASQPSRNFTSRFYQRVPSFEDFGFFARFSAARLGSMGKRREARERAVQFLFQ